MDGEHDVVVRDRANILGLEGRMSNDDLRQWSPNMLVSSGNPRLGIVEATVNDDGSLQSRV